MDYSASKLKSIISSLDNTYITTRAQNNDIYYMERMLTNSDTLHGRLENGLTPLMYAAAAGPTFHMCCSILLRYGAEINAQDNNGMALCYSFNACSYTFQ